MEKPHLPTQTPRQFLNAEEAAAYLGIAKITLYTYTSKRIIPYYKSRRKIYIKLADLDDFILRDQNRVKSVEEIEGEAKQYERAQK
jgi:excisionase family DNA binding protein